MGTRETVGRLDRRITIQRATTEPDAHGTPVETWADLCTTWAHMAFPLSVSGEQQFDAVHLATTNVVFTIRYRPGLLATDRVVYESEVYDITKIVPSPGPGQTTGQDNRTYLALTAELKK